MNAYTALVVGSCLLGAAVLAILFRILPLPQAAKSVDVSTVEPIVVWGKVVAIDGSTFAVNDGEINWTFLLSADTSIRRVSATDNLEAVVQSNQLVVGQAASITFDSHQTVQPLPALSIDIVSQ